MTLSAADRFPPYLLFSACHTVTFLTPSPYRRQPHPAAGSGRDARGAAPGRERGWGALGARGWQLRPEPRCRRGLSPGRASRSPGGTGPAQSAANPGAPGGCRGKDGEGRAARGCGTGERRAGRGLALTCLWRRRWEPCRCRRCPRPVACPESPKRTWWGFVSCTRRFYPLLWGSLLWAWSRRSRRA